LNGAPLDGSPLMNFLQVNLQVVIDLVDDEHNFFLVNELVESHWFDAFQC
jgi:hypothetical protein